ncbi:hypothetical protein CQW23_31632 [Capsicum baccatum]|uniref:Protein kinase domain-containing protein n=1 Tax=Capsicum baccatum TaxID=33114 RepID=A0A2G2V703_CAPBA|nr:hypothetical protein CQW23_31632 [Capsicum baccatum]
MDVKTAFLVGELEEEICMEQPEGFVVQGKENKVCKLVKSLYGLKQAPKDISDINAAKRMLESKFDMKDLGVADVILGIRIHRTSQGLALSQSPYIEKVLDKFKYMEFGIAKTPLDVSFALRRIKVKVTQLEYEVLNNIKGYPYIIRCYGDETTTGENSAMVYNLLLEYGSSGILDDRINKSGSENGLSEFEVTHHTGSMLRGLLCIHKIGYVHCDTKPDNVLLLMNSSKGSIEFKAKIVDLRLAKRENQSKKKRANESTDYMISLLAYGAVIGAWLGAWPMPLD